MDHQLTLFSKEEREHRFLELLEELVAISQEMAILVRIFAHPVYERAVRKVLPSWEEHAVYAASDGVASARDVSTATGVGRKKVQAWWREWAEKEMGESSPVRGGGRRFKATYTLAELALAVLEGNVKVD